MRIFQKKHHIEAMCKFIEDDLRPNYFLTFNFNPSRHRAPQSNSELEERQSISTPSAHKMLTDFFNIMQAGVFGKNWRRQTWRAWPTAVGFCEHEETNLHFHTYANLCPRFAGGLKSFGSEIWNGVNPSGTLFFDPIFDLGGALRYGMKEQWKIGKDETEFFYSDPRPTTKLADQLGARLRAEFEKALLRNARRATTR